MKVIIKFFDFFDFLFFFYNDSFKDRLKQARGHYKIDMEYFHKNTKKKKSDNVSLWPLV